MTSKSISQLEKEIKDLEKKKKEEMKRKELEEKLRRLKTPSKTKTMARTGPKERIRRGLGRGVSGALDRASSAFFG